MKNESHKTAIYRDRWTKPGRWLYEHFFQKDNITLGSMLDFGAGKSIDSECWTEKTGAIAQAYDKFEQPQFPGRGSRPDRKFELVTVIFVLNVVETDEERITILNDAMQYVMPDGYIFIATRSKGEIERARIRAEKKGNMWEEISPGVWKTGKNTIQCGVDDQDIQSLILKSDYSHFTYIELNEHPGSEFGCALFKNT